LPKEKLFMRIVASENTPVVNFGLILSFVIFYIAGAYNRSIFESLSFSPSLFFDRFPLWRIFSYAFLHYSFFHLAINSIFIYVFGNSLEVKIGHRQYFLLFISAAAVSAMFYAVFNANTDFPIIGASGGISAVVAGYAYHFSDQNQRGLRAPLFLYSFSRIFILIFIAIWFVIQYINSIMAFTYKTDTGWLVHVGGFVYGLLFSAVFGKEKN